MTKQHGGGFAGSVSEELDRIDALAQEIFTRLHHDENDAAVDDPHGYVLRLAESVLLQPSEDKRVGEVVDRLPQLQRELLLLHCNGLTQEQIAERRGLTSESVMEELIDAYSTLRWQLEPE